MVFKTFVRFTIIIFLVIMAPHCLMAESSSSKTQVWQSLNPLNWGKKEQCLIPDTKAQIHYSYSPLVKKTSPAVVSIFVLQVNEKAGLNPFMDDPFFQFFFGEGLGRQRSQLNQSLGSGVIISKNGIAVTCAHVVKNANVIKIKLTDDREFDATILTLDTANDLAFLKIKTDKPEQLPFLTIGDSEALEVGDLVLAIGNAFGIGQTVTSGIISALSRVVDGKILMQTDAAVNPGNSGGAFINMKGELIAVPNAILSKTGASHGIGFGIPAIVVQSLLSNITAEGEIKRVWHGMAVQTLTPDLAASFNLDQTKDGVPVKGAVVNSIHKSSPAVAANIMQGDIILSVQNKPISSADDFHFRIQIAKIGEPVKLQIWRKGEVVSTSLTLIPPPEIPAAEITKLEGKHALSGVTVANLSPGIALKYGLDDQKTGVVVLEDSARLQGYGLMLGDIILSFNGSDVVSVKDLKEKLEDTKRQMNLVIKRGSQKIVITTR